LIVRGTYGAGVYEAVLTTLAEGVDCWGTYGAGVYDAVLTTLAERG
jgi:hypothetical protein